MKVIDPGHVFDLDWVDGAPTRATIYKDGALHSVNQSRLIFVKREGEKYPGNVGHHPGTQIQEVCRALISRLQYVNGQDPHEANTTAIWELRRVIHVLEVRAAQRHGRVLSIQDTRDIEHRPTCPKCGHLECPGTCR